MLTSRKAGQPFFFSAFSPINSLHLNFIASFIASQQISHLAGENRTKKEKQFVKMFCHYKEAKRAVAQLGLGSGENPEEGPRCSSPLIKTFSFSYKSLNQRIIRWSVIVFNKVFFIFFFDWFS